MKKSLLAGLMLSLVIMLSACGKLNFDSGSGSTSGTKNSAYQTTGAVTSDMYQGVIKNGRYQTSSARGLTLSQNTQGANTFNIKSMENGLLNLSKEQFSPQKYVFQEGQLLSTSVARDWLGRESNSNPDGLNPKDNGKKDPDTRNPIYLQQVLEQDYMIDSGDGMKLGGISIALGLNKVDYYTKTQYGAQFSTTISNATLTEKGEAMAKKVVERLRKMSGVSADTPILVGLYVQAPSDSLVGGTFSNYTVSKSGTSLGSWQNLNEQNEVLPVVGNNKVLNTNVANDFSNFTTQINSFFPTLAGTTAQVHYVDKQLAGMKITINTQFYGETEIMSFTQYVGTSANKLLPSGVPIDITIQSVQGTQAFLSRASGDKSFYSHIFDSY